MDEIVFNVEKQEDGWYLATTQGNLKKGGIVTEASDYLALIKKVREAARFHLREGYHTELDLPENPPIRLTYSELLFQNPEAEKILITGSLENGSYRARTNTLLNLDISHKDFDSLREQVIKEIQQQGCHHKHIEFRLEEVLQ